LTVIFGQIFAYSAFSDSHFSSPGSVSGLIASTGHSGTQTPAIDAFVRVDDEHVLALVEPVHGAHVDAVHDFAANTAQERPKYCVTGSDHDSLSGTESRGSGANGRSNQRMA
jgi:hypothetical protein